MEVIKLTIVKLSSLALVFLFTGVLVQTGSNIFSYKGSDCDSGADHWNTKFSTFCGGSKQSPIDLVSSHTKFDNHLKPFVFHGFETAGEGGVRWTLINNGHTAQVDYLSGNLSFSGGSLASTFQVVQFHFHWGSNSSIGSEHSINGQTFPMELHVVAFNTNYDNLTSAFSYADGLAVLGFFFEVGIMCSSSYSMQTDKILALDNILPGYDQYFRYKGSLTTPTCNEIVTWTVFNARIPIGETQMAEFRLLQDDKQKKLVDNFRPSQPLNGRYIYANWKDFETDAIPQTALSGSLFLASTIINAIYLLLLLKGNSLL